jgi:hypothetical protein
MADEKEGAQGRCWSAGRHPDRFCLPDDLPMAMESIFFAATQNRGVWQPLLDFFAGG